MVISGALKVLCTRLRGDYVLTLMLAQPESISGSKKTAPEQAVKMARAIRCQPQRYPGASPTRSDCFFGRSSRHDAGARQQLMKNWFLKFRGKVFLAGEGDLLTGRIAHCPLYP
jgi:hypothetical protein